MGWYANVWQVSSLVISLLDKLRHESVVFTDGAILLCRSGRACFNVDLKDFVFVIGGGLTLFPNDMISLSEVSDDFAVEILRYDVVRSKSAIRVYSIFGLSRRPLPCWIGFGY